jgi:2-octaprenylphenol hydroxylase
MPPYHVLIAGAGPVGLATAALLSSGPAAGLLRIDVADVGDIPIWSDAKVDLRVYALSSAAQQVLEAAGALEAIASRRMSPYERMRVWEGTTVRSAGRLEFDSADIGESVLGHIVEDNLIRFALYNVLQQRANVNLIFGCQLESVAVTQRSVSVSFDGAAHSYEANLLIGADGSRSRVRDALQIRCAERDYDQEAIVAHVRVEREHQNTAWQRFLPGGPLALLPLADGRCSIVWSLPTAQAQQLLAAPPDDFGRRLTAASGRVLGALSLDSERVSLPLVARHAHEYCRSRAVLVGDAAHSVHPLAGQGVNLGLADVAELADQITAAALAGQDPGDLRVLQRYARARRGSNIVMLAALDGLDRLFRAPQTLSALRIAGLRMVDAIPPLKNQLIRHASGESWPRQQIESGHGNHAPFEDKF